MLHARFLLFDGGDLLDLRQGDVPLYDLSWLARTFGDPGHLFDVVGHRRIPHFLLDPTRIRQSRSTITRLPPPMSRFSRSTHPREGFVFESGDFHGDGRLVGDLRRLGVEFLAKGHDVESCLSQRRSHGRRRLRLSSWDQQTYAHGHFLRRHRVLRLRMRCRCGMEPVLGSVALSNGWVDPKDPPDSKGQTVGRSIPDPPFHPQRTSQAPNPAQTEPRRERGG